VGVGLSSIKTVGVTGFRGLWALKSGFRGLWAFKRFGRFVGVKGSVVLGGLWALEGV